MVLQSKLALFSTSFIVLFSPLTAFAIDQLPLPEAQISPAAGEVVAFVNKDIVDQSAKFCVSHLKGVQSGHKDSMNLEKIRALKAYRQCRADYALGQLAAATRQDNVN